MRNAAASIEAISAEANVSVPTIYRIISGKTPIKTEKHKLVQQLLLSRKIKPQQRRVLEHVVCVVEQNEEFPFLFFKAVEDYCHAHDIQLTSCSGVNYAMVEEKYSGDGVGCLCISKIPGEFYLPLVTVNRYLMDERCSSVNSDDYAGLIRAIGYLKSKGHRRIGFFNDFLGCGRIFNERRNMFSYAVKMCGLDYDRELEFACEVTPLTHVESCNLAVEYFLRLKNRPTALILPSDVYAPNFYEGLKLGGLKIPQDVSIMGFDDMQSIVTRISPWLTSMRLPVEEIVNQSFYALERQMENPSFPNLRIEVAWKLIERNSVCEYNG